MKIIPVWLMLLMVATYIGACQKGAGPRNICNREDMRAELIHSLEELTDCAPGKVGVALVSGKDTVTINNDIRFPMMSVFKLHEAIAVAHALEMRGETLDKRFMLCLDSLNPNTWSPMLSDYNQKNFDITAAKLIEYAITQSDNNASNILFKYVVGPSATDSYLKSIAKDTTFSIQYTEEQMARDHNLSYENFSSPLSAALLIGKVFKEDIVSEASTRVIRDALLATTTGADRIALPLKNLEGARVAHKTGSGYRNAKGGLIAFNDVAYISLPDGTSYSLAIMIRDFAGSEEEAASIMSGISKLILSYVTKTPQH